MAQAIDTGDVVKAGTEFAGTVVDVNGNEITVENRDGVRKTYHPNDLKHTA